MQMHVIDTQKAQGLIPIEGYASLFDISDLSGDQMKKGAFCKSLKRKPAHKIPMLWQHEPSEPIGFWQQIFEDYKGLYVKGYLIEDVRRSKELSALIAHKALKGLSIGFKTIKAQNITKADNRIHHIKPLAKRWVTEVDLWEISLVTFPMLPEAQLIMKASQRSASRTEHSFFKRPNGDQHAGQKKFHINLLQRKTQNTFPATKLRKAAKKLRQKLLLNKE